MSFGIFMEKGVWELMLEINMLNSVMPNIF